LATRDANKEVFCGVARLPREMSSADHSAYVAIEMEVDMEQQVVTDVVITACPRLCESMVITNMLGKNPVDGVAAAKAVIEGRYHGVAKGAVIAALQNNLQEFLHRRAAM